MRQQSEEVEFLELLTAIRTMTPESTLEPRFQMTLASRLVPGSTIDEQMLFVGNSILEEPNRMAVSYTHARCDVFNNFFVQNCLSNTPTVTVLGKIFVLTKPAYFPLDNNESSSISHQQRRLLSLPATDSERRFFLHALRQRH
jgi:hypothetical protein